MLNKLKPAAFYYYIYFMMFIIALSFWMIHDHGDLVLFLNDLHSPFLDEFFKWYTYLGDEFFIIVLVISLLIFNRRYGYILGIASITQGLIQLILKQVIFREVARPVKYFEGLDLLNAVEGVVVRDYHSFPSGHTITAFVAATFIALMLSKNRYSLILIVAAMLVGISRVYLAHHFLVDVMVGSLIGVLVSTCFYLGFWSYLKDLKERISSS